jgi:hypothetical protein
MLHVSHSAPTHSLPPLPNSLSFCFPQVIVLHIVRATLDANVAGVIDMYPAAWAAAADMLVEALQGAQLISLEQVRGLAFWLDGTWIWGRMVGMAAAGGGC